MRLQKFSFLGFPLLSFVVIAFVSSICLCMTGVQAQAAMNEIGSTEHIIRCCAENEQTVESCHNLEDSCCMSSCYSYSDQEIIKNENKVSPSLNALIIPSVSFSKKIPLENFVSPRVSSAPQGVPVRSVVQRE